MDTQKKIIKILIAEDSKLTTKALKTNFRNYNDIEVIGEAENGKIAIELIKKLQPDIVLMDIGMPIIDGIEATKQIKNLNLPTKIIMLTSHENEDYVLSALSAGAYSYCIKDIEPETLINAIKSTNNGDSWFDSRIAQIILKQFKNKPEKQVSNQESLLTERELEILKLIARGSSNSEISEFLFISLNTVKTHIKNIFQKFEVNDRTLAVITALKQSVIIPDDFLN